MASHPDDEAGAPGRWQRLDRPPLRVDALRHALVAPSGPLSRLEVLDAVGSTNAELARRAAAGGWPDLAVLTTDHQTHGRGRLDRTWTTPPRAALAVSVLLRPASEVPPEAWSWLPILAGVAVVDALRTVVGLDAHLKWPNDVLVPDDEQGPGGQAKVCGVLAEVVDTPEGRAVVVGFGLNVTQRRDELPVPTATSLLLAGAAVTDRDTVLRACLRSLATAYRGWADAGGDAVAAGLVVRAREACSTLGQRVRVEGIAGTGPLVGVAEGLDDDGRLLVREAGGELRAVAAGDVVHLRPDEREQP